MAGRIPQTFIDDLLTRIDIIDVIDGYVPLKKAGRNHQAHCPFHDEKTPSFTVSQEKQFYHCFGCGANGTAISFLMDYAGMDFVEAIEDLAARAGLEVPREGGGAGPKESGVTELYELMELAIRHFGKQLREHPEAQRAIDYLKGRGISGQLAAEYELGFAPPGWDGLITALGQSKDAQTRLEKAGLLIKKDDGGYYDRFRDRIIFPIRDQRGRAIGVGGRVLGEGTPKYLNSPETPIFHKGRELYGLYQARRKTRAIERLFVVEGYMDVLALAQHGITNAVATLGTAVTPEHLDRLFKACAQIVFCFDGDSAGRKAAWRALEIALPLLRDGRQVHFMFMPEGEDPDTFVRQHGAEVFNKTNSYIPLTDFLFDYLKNGANLNNEQGKWAFIEKSMPYLEQIKSGSLRNLLNEKIQEVARVNTEEIDSLIKQISRKEVKNTKKVSQRQGVSTNTVKAIRLLLHYPNIGLDQSLSERLERIQDQGVEFLRELLDYIQNHPQTSCAGILEHWRDTRYASRLQELAAMENPLAEGNAIEENHIKQEFLDYISRIEHIFMKKQREIESRNIQNLEEFRKFYGKFPDSPKD